MALGGGEGPSMTGEVITREVLHFAERALLPDRYLALAEALGELASLGLRAALDERLEIDGLDVRIAAGQRTP